MKKLNNKERCSKYLRINHIKKFSPQFLKTRKILLNGEIALSVTSNLIFQLKMACGIIPVINLQQILSYGLHRLIGPHIEHNKRINRP
jgi:hypothetical protein